MRNKRKTVGAAIMVLALGSMVSASVTYTENFEAGYTSGDNLVVYPNWFCDSRGGDYSPVVEGTSGLAGSVGLGQAQNSFTWKAQSFDWSDPNVTQVVIGLDLESTWIPDGQTLETYKPFDDDMLGWAVNGESTSSDMFGVQLEGNEIRGRWANAGTSTISTVMAVIPGYVDPLSWFRLRVTYTKLTAGSLRMDVSLTGLDEVTGELDSPVASGTILDTSAVYSSGSKQPAPANFVGPMWVKNKNYNASAGNVDNFYLEVIPEPASILLVLGAGALMLRRRSA